MAETANETRLRASLKEVLQSWIDTTYANDSLSYVGNNAASAMADASFAVLIGMADLEEYFKAEKMLTT